jgi:uncharacterized paraquat-inducible protein A
MITLTATFDVLGRKMEVFRETRNLLQTVESLHDSGNDFVAGLVFFFGVVVPIGKGLLLVAALLLRAGGARRVANGFARAISKWAMNDVFVVATYVSFLSAKATDALDAKLEPGFFWFTAYVLLSLLALSFLKLESAPSERPA